ncbi:MAG: RNA-binding cell elongation regulator Jag/EloR [Clostridiales bacterium]
MRKEFEASGKTIEQAIDNACALAGTTIDNVDVEIIALGGKRLFGFGQKDARVKVILETPDLPIPKQNRDKAERGEKTVVPERSGKAERGEKTAIPERNNKAERGEKTPIPERSGKAERRDKNEAKLGEQRNPSVAKAVPQTNGMESKSEERNKENRGNRGEQRAYGKKETAPRSESHITMVVEGEMAEELRQNAMAFLVPIFEKLKCAPEVRSDVKEGILWLSLTGSNLGLLIGRRGDTLNSLQYLTNLAVNKHRTDHVRLVLDVEGYRANREETLTALAHKMADKAVRSGRRVEFEPMNPHERRIVHLALQDDKRVDTGSRGEEPYRRVVISRRRTDNKKRVPGGANQNPPQGQPQVLPEQTASIPTGSVPTLKQD